MDGTRRPSQPGFLESRGEGDTSLLRILLFWPFGVEARILPRCCDCGPVSDVGERSLWSSKGCVEALLTVSTPPASHPDLCVCVCVLLLLLTACRVHVTAINTASHEPSHMISCSVPLHRGGHLTFLSSWRITILPSLPRVHLAPPLLPPGRPAQLAERLDQATPACSGAKLPGSQRRSPQAATFLILPSKQPLHRRHYFSCVR